MIWFTGFVSLSYKCLFDSEPYFDRTYVEYDAGGGNWVYIADYQEVDTLVVEHTVYPAQVATKLRFHFISDNVWSDEDGLWDTDGAFIVDSITVRDVAGMIDYEDFETYPAGATTGLGIWDCVPSDAFGSYAALRNNLISEDPCGLNFSTAVAFFDKSMGWVDEECITPYCTGPGGIEPPCHNEEIVSPVIDMAMYSTSCDEIQDAVIPPGDAASLDGVLLRYAAYVDLPRENLVFRTYRVRNIEDGCPGIWQSPGYVFPDEPLKVWYQESINISDMVTSADAPLQVALGVIDMCSLWYGVYGDCSVHTRAPWYDNVRVYRYSTGGPVWSVDRGELFQDTFPQEVPGSPDPMEEFCRADMATDIASYRDRDLIIPGDSAVVKVYVAGDGGLDTLDSGEEMVFCHVNTTFLGPDGKPDLYGAQLEGDYGRYISDDGDWTVLLCEQAYYSNGNEVNNTYCIDLNDSLFTRGYMIEYYFKAYALSGESSTWPANAESMPPSAFFGTSNLLEFTCLPTLRAVPGMLYVDDFDGRGTHNGVVQLYFDWTFRQSMPLGCMPDRYDVNAPSSGLSNGVGAYTSADYPNQIFCQAYEIVIFDSGDLDFCTVSEGTEHSDKSNDAQLLVDWMYASDHPVGLLIMGDNIASDLDGSASAVALELAATMCGVVLESSSYLEKTGGVNGGGTVSPIVTGIPGTPFAGLSYYAFGGCPWVNDFDVLWPTGYGHWGLAYPDYGGATNYAGIWTEDLNGAGYPLRTFWVGHSFQYIRDVQLGWLVRNIFVRKVMDLFEQEVSWDFVDTELPKATALSRNFPNPFNPVTRLKFALKEKGPVSLRVYDVSGRLVRVLVDEVREAGSYEAVWDGTNDEGRGIASGIYFCRMEAGEYERTLKMVLLK